MAKIINFMFKPPYGVTFNQFADGTIRFNYVATDTMTLSAALRDAANKLRDEAIERLRQARKEEVGKTQLPMTTVQQIDIQLNELVTQKVLEEMPEIPVEFAAEARIPNGHDHEPDVSDITHNVD